MNILFYSLQSDGRESLLTINNLKFTNYYFSQHSGIHWITSMQTTFICNSCVFSNITIDSSHNTVNNESALMVGPDVEFHNCLFQNISYHEYVYNDY